MKIAENLEEAKDKIKGRALFGGHILEPVMAPHLTEQRFQQWQHARAEALEALARHKQ